MANHPLQRPFFALLALLLLAPVVCAGIQRRESICQLSVNKTEQLYLHEGRVGLVSTSFPGLTGSQDAARTRQLAEASFKKWFISAPSIKSDQNTYLATDPDDQEPHLVLTEKSGSHAEWAFEFSKQEKAFDPSEGKGFRSGIASSTFKLLVTAGKFKGYYVGAESLSEAQKQPQSREPAFRALKLVKDKRDAVEFEYVEARYWVIHK